MIRVSFCNAIIEGALREHYRLITEKKRVPSDYLLMYTEGGESNAVASAILKALGKYIERHEQKLNAIEDGDERADAAFESWQKFKKILKNGQFPQEGSLDGKSD